jgi:CheY-like chemotaxis protein
MTNTTLAESAPAPRDDGTFELPSLHGLRVLVVDDDADARDAVRAVLEDSGAEVIAFASASEALAEIKNVRPDVLVSDIAMPGLDGYELIRHVRAGGRGARTRAIAITAHTGPDVRARVLAAGFDACVTKPLEADALIALLGALGDPPGT